MNDILLNGTAENTLADGNDDIAAVNDRTDDNAALGTAVGLCEITLLKSADYSHSTASMDTRYCSMKSI